MSANFSDLQQVTIANNADQMMLRLDNGATGPDGFARITVSNLNSVFTSSLTAADAKVKQASASWDAAYSQVNANSGVFTLVGSNSANWDTAYNAISSSDYNLENKVFDYITVQGPNDTSKVNFLTPVFKVEKDQSIPSDLVQVIPDSTTSVFRITSGGNVGINIPTTQELTDALYINGSQYIDKNGEGTGLTVFGDVVVLGSLSALSATFINSIVTNTSALSVVNTGGGPALTVNQNDSSSVEPIASFKSLIANITFNGNGDATGFKDLSGTGNIIYGTNASKSIYNNVFVLGSNIVASQSDYTYVTNLSSPGTVAANNVAAGGKTSSDWNSTYTTVNATSSNWNSVYSSFNAQSAANASVYSSVNAASSNWNSTYSTTNANSATWSTAGGLGNIFTSVSANALSATKMHALTATGVATDIDVALVAKGTGATVAQIPDNAASGGNARGQYATDWQKNRNAASQTASGAFSTICGGGQNTASGSYSTVAGGVSSSATNTGAFIGGGLYNAATNQGSVVVGGSTNVASGLFAIVGGGANNTASGVFASIIAGINNTNSKDNAHIIGSNITAPSANYTYVNNLSSQGIVTAASYGGPAAIKAWVNFDGVGTGAAASVTIRDSYNVNKVARISEGIFTIEFTPGTFSTSNYIMMGNVSSNYNTALLIRASSETAAPTIKSSLSCQVMLMYGAANTVRQAHTVCASFMGN